MKLNIYSIFDTVAEVFNKPFTDINNATAIRSFTQSVLDQPHKNDYVLYNMGEFDDNSGHIQPNKTPTKILSGFDVKNENQEIPEMLKQQA
ncbi:nonstructural protein [Microviridae sp.]|nr:nonstructural protein [Microviridae sp.]